MMRRVFFILAASILSVSTLGQGAMSLRDSGIEFPDGSVQTSAALGLGATARAGLNARCFASSATQLASCTAYTVPTGKILVLEAVSVRLTKLPDREMRAMLRVKSGGSLLDPLHWIPYQQIGMDGVLGVYGFAGPLRMYYQPGEQVHFQVISDSTGSNHFDFAFSGYLVEASP